MTALFILAAEHRALSDKLHNLELDDQTIADTLEGEGGDMLIPVKVVTTFKD